MGLQSNQGSGVSQSRYATTKPPALTSSIRFRYLWRPPLPPLLLPPLRDLSKNVRFDLASSLAGETLANLKSVYSEKEAFYLLILPATLQVYCFDTKQSLQDGASRVTKWDSISPTCAKSLRNGDLYIGKNGYIGKYGTYLDDTSSYRFLYYTLQLANQTQAPLSAVLHLSLLSFYGVLATVSQCYPPPIGRFLRVTHPFATTVSHHDTPSN